MGALALLSGGSGELLEVATLPELRGVFLDLAEVDVDSSSTDAYPDIVVLWTTARQRSATGDRAVAGLVRLSLGSHRVVWSRDGLIEFTFGTATEPILWPMDDADGDGTTEFLAPCIEPDVHVAGPCDVCLYSGATGRLLRRWDG
jgi:hypothetical protein